MRFSQRSARDRRRWLIPLLIAALLLGGFPPPPATADPPDRGIASVADGSADDVLGQTLNMDFSQPDFTHGGANDSVTAEGLNQPVAVAVDTVNHRLFVADTTNHRVLVFDLTAANALADRRADRVLGQAEFKGQLANRGSSAAANTLNQPQGLAYDTAGNRLFVADTSNMRVLVYDTTTITNGQSAVAVMGQATFTSTTGATTQSGLQWPRELGYDAGGRRLFVSDETANRVLVYDTTTISNGEDAVAVLGQANFTSSAGATTQSGLSAPAGLAYDSTANRLFVADWSNSRVLVYDVAVIGNGENAINVLGQANFISGNANGGGSAAANTLSGPIGAAYDPNNNRLLVADYDNHRVLVYDVATIANGENAVNVLGQTTFTSTAATTTQSGLNAPNGLAYEATGNRLFVADRDNYRVLVYDVAAISDGENAVDLVGQLDGSGNPVYTTKLADATRVNNMGLSGPQGVALDTVNHRLFLADTSNHRVLVYNLDASDRLLDRQPDAVLGQADFTSGSSNRGGSAAANTLAKPTKLAYDDAGGRLFVTDENTNRVLVYDTTTITNGQNAVAVLGQASFSSGAGATTQSGLSIPSGLAYDSSGSRLFVADLGNNRVLVYDTTAVTNGQNAVAVLGQANFTSSAQAITQSGLRYPSGLAYDASGNRLFVADSSSNRVVAYDVAGIANGENAVNVLGQANFTSSGSALTQGGFSGPQGLAYDSSGNRLFAADATNNRVLVYDTITITNGENAVAVLGQANFTSGSGNRGSSVAANTLSSPVGVAYDASANILYIADGNNRRVLLFNAAPTGTAVSINGGATYASSITATLALTATGATQMQVSESPAFTGATYQTYTTTLPWSLSTGDGPKAVYGRFQDSLGGVSTAVSDTIILDTTPPVTLTLASPATGAYTNTASPTFAWESSSDALSGLAKYQLYIDGALNRDNVVTTTISITPTGVLTDGLHTWNMVAVDNAGNTRQSTAITLTVDVTPPITFSLSSPATGAFTNTASPTFAWESSSDATSGLAKYQLYIDGALNRDSILTGTLSITPTGTLTDGLHTWNMVTVDNAGNSRGSTGTYTVTVDTVAPSLSGVGASGVTTRTATITYASSEAASSQVEYGLTDAYGSATTEVDTSPRVISHTVGLSGLTPGTAYHYRAKGRDQAGNLGVSSDGTFTTTTTAVLLYLPILAKNASTGW